MNLRSRASRFPHLATRNPFRNTNLDNLVRLPEAIEEFIAQLQKPSEFDGDERRSAPRVPVSLPVLAIAIDEKLEPYGPAFTAVTRDISSTGVGLITVEPVLCPLLAIRFHLKDRGPVQVGMKISRCRPLHNYFEATDCDRVFYDVAGPFLTQPQGDSDGEF